MLKKALSTISSSFLNGDVEAGASSSSSLGESSKQTGKIGQSISAILAERKKTIEIEESEKVEPSIPQKIVESSPFQMAVAVIIGLNGLMIGVVTDYDFNSKGPEWRTFNLVQEYFFASAFLIELGLKLLAYKMEFFTGNAYKWNLLDFLLVMLSVFESFVLAFIDVDSKGLRQMSVLRMLRLLRLLRMLRLLKAFKQLWYLVSGLLNAIPVTCWGCLLAAFVVYVFAIFATSQLQDFAEDDPLINEYFGSIPRSMFTLIQVTTGDSWASGVVRPVLVHSPNMVIFFILFVCLTQFAVLNVVVAVIVENVLKEAMETEQEKIQQAEQELRQALYSIFDAFQEMDRNKDGTLTRREFLEGLSNPLVRTCLSAVGITMESAEEMFDILDYDGSGTMSLEEFTNGCMKGRGTAQAKDLLHNSCQIFAVKDSVNLILEKLSDQGIFMQRLRSIESELEHVGDGSCLVPVERHAHASEKHASSNVPIPSPRPSPSQKHLRHMSPSCAAQSKMKQVWDSVKQQFELLDARLHEMPMDSCSWELIEALAGIQLRTSQANEEFFPNQPAAPLSPLAKTTRT
eukprot:gnl/MRDRNA2_/MRDRNA2_148969_c0_seq1.p1 gnl/MRDRNA2_/MRDRNA2_148969_c0~~gnl/MRDRNA2_/MRDRNA2_148969_c0_seq1.p1  ORF type:complete len:573 (-),score=98.42 gnl/MRDRNA2_/MRDRNA2_148969_c0_seq1:565-2283(-)